LTFVHGMFLLGMARPRLFPPPWKVEELEESYAILDASGQRLAYVYFEDQPQRQMSLKRMSKDEAWKLARAITRIPSLMQRD